MTLPIRNNTERNRRKRENKRNKRIQQDVVEMGIDYGAKLLQSLTDEDVTLLKSLPHPKLPDVSELTLFSYLEWLCSKGYHKKGVSAIEQHVQVGDYKSLRLACPSEHTVSTCYASVQE